MGTDSVPHRQMNAADRDRHSIFRSGGFRWVLAMVGFTVGACLVVAGGALLLFVISEHGDQLVASERTRSLFALVIFATLLAVSTYLLAVASFRNAR